MVIEYPVPLDWIWLYVQWLISNWVESMVPEKMQKKKIKKTHKIRSELGLYEHDEPNELTSL